MKVDVPPLLMSGSGLSRDGCQTYGNHHVEQRLRDGASRLFQYEESGESAVAFFAIRPRTNRQT